MTKKRSDGDGSVFQLHTKDCPRPTNARGKTTCKCKWRGAIITGYKRSESGRSIPVRKTVSAATEQACAAKVRDLRAELEKTTLPVGKTPTLEQWLNHCHSTLLPRQKKRPRETTMVKYRYCFDSYLIPTMGHVRLNALTAEDIESVWDLLQEEGNPTLPAERRKPLSTSTVAWTHTILRRMLRLAQQKKMLTVNPAGPDSMDAPSPADAEVTPLETEQWKKVLKAAEDTPNAARWTVALAIGLRQGEALALRWSDVDLDNGTLRVQQIAYRLPGRGVVFGEPKTERSKREIALPATLLAELKRHRKEQNEARLVAGDAWDKEADLVFPTPFGKVKDASVDRKTWKALLEKADVPHVKLHAARHTAATMMLLQGIDPRVVMDIMGWSQITTAARYRHAVDEAKRSAAEKIDQAFA